MTDSPQNVAELCAEAVAWSRRASTKDMTAKSAEIFEQFRRTMGVYWHTIAQTAAYDLREHGAEVDKNRIGYVVLPLNRVDVHIPFFMIDLFPLGADLQDIASLGTSVQLSTGSVICLSGSTCQVGKINQIADLDFCEYLPTIDDECVDRLRDLSKHLVHPETKLVRVSLGHSENWESPWADCLLGTAKSNQEIIDALTRANFRQCVFVGRLPSFGALEITNVFLAIDFTRPEGSIESERSFAFQEIPISDGHWTPRNLDDPINLGRYLLWLEETVRENIEASRSKPRAIVKAARRLVSLCRIAFLGALVDSVIEALKKDGALLAAIHDRCELYSSIAIAEGSAMEGFKIELLETIVKMRAQLTQAGSTRVEPAYVWTKDDTLYLEQYAASVRPLLAKVRHEVRQRLNIN